MTGFSETHFYIPFTEDYKEGKGHPVRSVDNSLQTPKLTLAWAMLCLLLGCSTPQVDPPMDESILAEPPFILLDAYKGDEQFFLRYVRGNNLFYAAGKLRSSAPVEGPVATNSYDTPVVAPIDSEKPRSWEELTHNLTPVPVLSLSDWIELRADLFPGFMSREPNQGVAVSFDRLDYFFFYDRAGNFRSRRLIDKPPWYTVSAQIDLREYFDKWQPILIQFMKEAGLESEDVIFTTGDLERGAIPFLYINTHTKLIVLVQYDELPETVIGTVPGGHVLKTIWHFVESHSFTVLMRPFSTVQSLLSVVSDTAVQTGHSLVTTNRFKEPIPSVASREPMDRAVWEDYLDRELGRESSRGRLKFLVDGSGFFPRFKDAVTSAQSSVDIRAYIFDNDDVALEIAELLKRRSREGLDVRVLFDGLGTITASAEESSSLPEDHRAPGSIASFLKKSSEVQVRATSNPWLTGDHVKTMVIDRELAFLGGMNIGREYRYDWHDIMVEVTGPIVDDINYEFDRAWGQAGFWGDFSMLFKWGPADKSDEDLEGYPVRLLQTTPARHDIFRLQREAISRAQSYVYIENAYFTEDSLLRELIKARRRGVDVRVIIPLETDRGVITRNITLVANIMLANGIRVFIYPGFSHAKAAIFDGWASLGSANLDRLSLKINKEINLATSEPVAVQALFESLFKPDFEKSTELEEPFPERWTDHLIEMFGDYVF